MQKSLLSLFSPTEETNQRPAPRPLNPDKPANKKQRRGPMHYRRTDTKLHGGGAR